MQCRVMGLASKKESTILLEIKDQDQSLMQLLINNNYPISSSCFGEGVCKKCFVLDELDSEVISCQITTLEYVEKHGEKIKITYL